MITLREKVCTLYLLKKLFSDHLSSSFRSLYSFGAAGCFSTHSTLYSQLSHSTPFANACAQSRSLRHRMQLFDCQLAALVPGATWNGTADLPVMMNIALALWACVYFSTSEAFAWGSEISLALIWRWTAWYTVLSFLSRPSGLANRFLIRPYQSPDFLWEYQAIPFCYWVMEHIVWHFCFVISVPRCMDCPV